MIIDTSFYSQLKKGHPEAIKSIDRSGFILMPLISIAEIWKGAHYGEKFSHNSRQLEGFLAMPEVEVVSLTLDTARIYGELAAECRRRGRALSNNDMWLAALAKEHQAPLYIFDKDFIALESLVGKGLVKVLE